VANASNGVDYLRQFKQLEDKVILKKPKRYITSIIAKRLSVFQ